MNRVLATALMALSALTWISPSQAEYEDMPLEQKVAIIDANTFVSPKDVRVARYRYLLESLQKKTGEPKSLIGDKFSVARDQLRERYGKEATILSLMEVANKSEALSKKQVALTSYLALLVVTVGSN